MSDNIVEFKIKLRDEAGNAVQSLSAGIEDASDAADKLVKHLTKVGDTKTRIAEIAFDFERIGNMIGRLGDVFGSLTASAESFNEAMRRANTMAGKGEEDFQRLKKSVAALSREIPLAREELADGLYQVISNAVPEDNWLSFLEASAKSAVGGVADLGKVVTVTSTLIKNYGLSWEEAAAIQDKIQMTAKNGVTSFEQLAEALPRVASSAASLGVDVDELMASFATLTGVSGNTAEVATQLSAVLSALMGPTSEAAKLAGEMGIQFDAAAIKGAGGLVPFLRQLNSDIERFAQGDEALIADIEKTLFGSVQGLRALLPLTGELAGKFEENAAAMASAGGTVSQSFEQMTSTVQAHRRILDNVIASLSDMASRLLGSTIPAYVQFAAQAGTAITTLSALGGSIKTLTTTKIALAAKTAVCTAATKTWTAVTVTARRALDALKVASIATKAAIGGVLVVAVTAAVGVIGHLTRKSREAKRALEEMQAAEKERAEAAAQEEQDLSRIAAKARTDIALYIEQLKAAEGDKKEEARLVAELNNEYGEAMGTYDSIAAWYDTLTKKSEIYCKQLVAEARQRRNADKIADLQSAREAAEKKRDELDSQMAGIPQYVTETPSFYTPGIGLQYNKPRQVENKEFIKLKSEYEQVTAEIARLTTEEEELSRATSELIILQAELHKELGMTSGGGGGSTSTMSPGGTPAPALPKVSALPDLQAVDIGTGDLSQLVAEAWQGMMDGIDTDLDDHFAEVSAEAQRMREAMANLQKTGVSASDVFGTLGGVMRQLGGAVGSGAAAWLEWGANLAQSISAAIPLIASLTTAKRASATANAASAITGAADSVASIPFVGWAMAIGAAAAMMAALTNMPKFAEGGLAYGPTMGIFGEYAGARSNPEVVAPLDRLRSLLQPAGLSGGEVRFRIEGRHLAGILKEEQRFTSRTR